ncbi:hypothetical protein NPQ37_14420 [Staphylococcus aureus]|uniref:hypothetical protein n=1 Tax=Staphylococcus aureus TaxID=1280 RepID=UPI00211B08BC|nr:hypothetical protein [Staphylococcus aureus]MCQ6817041.1 hypothetical protein [Staphylococcus aureus]
MENFNYNNIKKLVLENVDIDKVKEVYKDYELLNYTIKNQTLYKSSPDSCVKCYTMFLPFLLIKIDVFS